MQKIREQFDTVIRNSQNIAEFDTTELFDIWETNKKPFYELFGKKYIYTFPDNPELSLNLPPKIQRSKVHSFITWVAEHWGYPSLAEFIEENQVSFFDNVVALDYTAPDGTVIKAGSKLIRSFKHFIPFEDTLKTIQDEASMIVQANNIKGYLHLSIHPLDFLSLSENVYNWRSCHSLDGDYRAGNLSYMGDGATIIAYLSDQKEYILPRFGSEVPWNSKRWRTLIHFSKDKKMIFAGRSYPYESDVLLNKVKELLGTLFPDKEISKWTDTRLKQLGEEIFYENSLYPVIDQAPPLPLSDFVIDAKSGLHYNDVLYSSCYVPKYCFVMEKSKLWLGPLWTIIPERTDIKIPIGADINCLRCNCSEISRGEGTMLCNYCRD